MKFVADEGVERAIVERLRADGHEISYVAELDPGLSDDSVLGLAAAAQAPLLTSDKDFGELVVSALITAHVDVLRANPRDPSVPHPGLGSGNQRRCERLG